MLRLLFQVFKSGDFIRCFAFLGLLFLTILVVPPARAQLKDDETLVFFDTTAWQEEGRKVWVLPIHGWVYEKTNSLVRKNLIEALLREKYGLIVPPATRDNFERRVDSFLADNERGKTVLVEMAGRRFPVGPSEANGHLVGRIELPIAWVEKNASSGTLVFQALDPESGRAVSSGKVFLIPPEGFSVISDIDDTIKLTHVTDRVRMLEMTFLRDYAAVPGMAKVYADWVRRGAFVHFVSSSPWQLYPFLRDFVLAAGFPDASFSLKLVRFKDETLLDLFEKGTETKPPQIEAILRAYPRRRFILVGDSGEQDPEVYAATYRRHPRRIERIYIRNVTDAKADDARFRKVFEGLDPKIWRLFTDPETMTVESRGAVVP